MKEPAVADSTCLITLQRIGQIELLHQQFAPVLVPPAVSREFGESYPWLVIQCPSAQPTVAALRLMLDDGEAEAIVLAQQQDCRVILDDGKARRIARDLGLTITGTIGVLIRAKRHGHCSAIGPLLRDLQDAGFYISQALRDEALRIAGEAP